MKRSNACVRALERAVMPALLRLSRRSPGAPRPREPEGSHRALICKWCCLGDAVVSLYAMREFKRRHPEAVLDVLVSRRIAEVYRHAPEIDRVYVLPLTGRRLARELLSPRLWVEFLALLRALRRNRYAQFVDLELYRGTGPVLKRLIGIPFSRGFAVEGALPKHHDFEVPLPRHAPEWQCFYGVLGMDAPESEPPPLFPIPRPSPGTGRRARIGLVFGSSFNWPQKKWPWERYAELARRLADAGHACVLFGAPGEEAEAARILAAAGPGAAEDSTGRLEYQGLRREVSACDVVVGNDTGTLHLAAACGVPVIALFGPTDPRKWKPIGARALYLETLPCRPCYYLGSMPDCSHFSCLRGLEVSTVLAAIQDALADGNPPAAPSAEDSRARKAQPG